MNTKEVQEILLDWYSPNVVNHYHTLQLIMMGFGMTPEEVKKNAEQYLATSSPTATGQLIYYPPILRGIDQMRMSNPILKNMRILASQIRGVDIVPDWQGVPDYINVSRKAWWINRSKGADGYVAFKNDTDDAFIDFSMLGIGFMRICVNKYEDIQRVTGKYISPLDVISDPYLQVDESPGVGLVSMMGKSEFESKFVGKSFDEYKQMYSSPAGFTSTAVRMIEWYDADNYIAIPNQIGNEPILVKENEFGCIPLQAYTNFKPSGSLLPMGLIEMQLASAIDIVQMTNDIRRRAKNDGFIAIEPSFFTPESLKKYSETKDIEYLQIDTEKARALYQIGAKPFIEIPRVPNNPDVMNLLQLSTQENREQSAVSASAAGVVTSSETTATEIRSIDSRMDAQYKALLRTFTRSHAGFCVKIAKIAEKFDNAPFSVSYRGTPIEINMGDPRATSEYVWEGVKIPYFEDESLFSQDAAARIAMEVAKYEKIFAITQSQEAVKDMIESLGIDTPDKYMQQPQSPMGMPPQGGMPPEGAMPPAEEVPMEGNMNPDQISSMIGQMSLGGGQQPPL